MIFLQRRHRAWMAFVVLAAVVLTINDLNSGTYLLGFIGITLLYASGFIREKNHFVSVAGFLLLATAAILCLSQNSETVPLPAALLTGFLVGAPSLRILAHFIHVPDTFVRVGSIFIALTSTAFIIAIVGPWSSQTGVVLACLLLLAASLAGTERLWQRWARHPSKRQASLSVLMICYNEADRIEESLSRVAGWADEIIVVDSGSTDGTTDIARKYTEHVFHADWAGYGRQKQHALERCTGDWVLNLDADELVEPLLRDEIDAWLSSTIQLRAFRICWVSIVFSKPVFFGADGRYHKRLFRREGARFDLADVHEDIVIDGPVARLCTPVLHDTFRDYSHLKAKFTRYALISADRMAGRGRMGGPITASLHGISAFLILYFRRLGVLDGRRGLMMAVTYAVYTFDKYAAAWAKKY